MKLLLTSAGLTNKTIIDALASLCSKPFEQLKLAFIPTASNVESGDKWWVIKDLTDCQMVGFPSVDIVDISALPLEMIQKRFEDADVLFFCGGNTYHLAYWLQKSGVAKILPELLKTRVYVGESAGSMVASKNLILADTPMLYEEEIGKEKIDGLGLTEFNIRPHFNSKSFPHVNEENVKKIAAEIKVPLYAIDDQTAIKIVDGKTDVVSEGAWKQFNA